MTAAQYPKDLDVFRRYLDAGNDHLYAADMNDAMGVAVAIETEMGIRPSGIKGTVWGRLFETGNLGIGNSAGWRPLTWDGSKTYNEAAFWDRNVSGLGSGNSIAFNPGTFVGQETIWGEDTPAFFGSLQSPTTTGLGPQNRGGVPWRHCLVQTQDDFVSWVAIDAEAREMTVYGTGQSFQWAYILWNLQTGGATVS